jgi:hypothetical protein
VNDKAEITDELLPTIASVNDRRRTYGTCAESVWVTLHCLRHGEPRREIALSLRRISVASLCVLIALLAVDCAWYRRAFLEHRSAFGFGDAPAFDTGVIPMSNILAIGIYLAATRKVRAGPFLIGFEVAGLVAIVSFIALAWTWPDGVRLWLRPIYTVWSRWSSGPLPDIYILIGDTACFLPLQVLFAAGGGLLARVFWARSGRTAPSDRITSC